MNSFESGRVWDSEKPPPPSTALTTSWRSFFQSAEIAENTTFAFILVPFVPEHLRGRQQARIEAPQEFDVEIVDETEGAWIRIPESIVESDPRWQILAANGVLKAK